MADNVVAHRDQPVNPGPVDVGGEAGLQGLDRVQAYDTFLPDQAVGGRGPNGMIPAPFEPNDVSPVDGVGEERTGSGAGEPHVVVLFQCRNQRGEERVVPPLDPVSQQQSCHIPSMTIAGQVAAPPRAGLPDDFGRRRAAVG